MLEKDSIKQWRLHFSYATNAPVLPDIFQMCSLKQCDFQEAMLPYLLYFVSLVSAVSRNDFFSLKFVLHTLVILAHSIRQTSEFFFLITTLGFQVVCVLVACLIKL